MLSVRNLTKVYRPKKGAQVNALKNINLDIADKGLVFLLGKSGSGKSTLLNILGGLDSYTTGEIIIKGKSSSSFSQADFDSYRNTFLGFVFQEFNILEDYTVGKNISLALELQRKKSDKQAVEDILTSVDLQGYYDRKPNELSGGQKQRVSIARALIKNPDIILADEPTGSLDTNTGKQVFEVLKKLAQQKLIIVVSHDRENAELYADRIIELADGDIISDRTRTKQGQLQDTPPINFLSQNLVQIKAGYQLNCQDVANINTMLATSTANAYLSLDAKANLPFDAKAVASGGIANFEGTNPSNLGLKQYNPQDFALLHSRLPFKDALKMGAGGLKLKPIRLCFIILLSFVAFTMFGFSLTAGTVNSTSVNINNFVQHKYKNIVVSSVGSLEGQTSIDSSSLYEDKGNGIEQKHIDALEEATGTKHLKVVTRSKNSYTTVLNLNTIDTATPYANQYFSPIAQGINNLVEIDNAELANIKPINGASQDSRLPENVDEIAISDWTYQLFEEYGFKEWGSSDESGQVQINDVDDIIGKQLHSIYGMKTITGVFSTDIDMSEFAKYNKVSTSNDFAAGMLMSSVQETMVGMAYVNVGFEEQAVLENTNTGGEKIEINSNDKFFSASLKYGLPGSNNYYNYLNNIFSTSSVDERYRNDVLPKDIWQQDTNTIQLQDDEVLLGSGVLRLESKTDDEVLEEFAKYSSTAKLTITIRHISNSGDFGDEQQIEFKVKGIMHHNGNIAGNSSSVFGVVYSDAMIEKFQQLMKNSSSKVGPYKIILPTNGSKSVVQKVFKHIENSVVKVGDALQALRGITPLSGMLDTVGIIVNGLGVVFLWLGLIFAIFAGLLLMNFIGVSIFHKKKHIGILRAIGARGRDVFKIFFIESLLIAGGIFVLSSIATTIISVWINSMITINVMVPGLITFVGLAGLALVITFVSTWFPVRKIAKKKPVDAINNR